MGVTLLFTGQLCASAAGARNRREEEKQCFFASNPGALAMSSRVWPVVTGPLFRSMPYQKVLILGAQKGVGGSVRKVFCAKRVTALPHAYPQNHRILCKRKDPE